MRDFPPLKALRVFWFLAEYGSVKEAANQLFVTQAAISHQVRALEEYLGEAVFEKRGRKLVLTAAGERLLPYVREGFNAIQGGVEVVRHHQNPNHLVLSVLPSFAACWLVPRLPELYKRYPDLNLEIRTLQAQESNIGDSDDLAIRYCKGHFHGLHVERLMGDWTMAVASPEYLTEHPVSLDNLADHALIEDIGECTWEDWLKAQAAEHEQSLHKCLRVSNAAMVLDAAKSGQGLALVRYSLAKTAIDGGELTVVFDFKLDTGNAYYLVAHTERSTKLSVRRVRQWLKQEVQRSFGDDDLFYFGA